MTKLLLALTLLLPVAAHADFVPGRVRATASAKLKILSATGHYAGVKTASLSLLAEDGKPGVVGYVLSLNGNPTKFTIRAKSGSSCGITSVLALNEITSGSEQVTAELIDYSSATCEMVITNLWNVKVQSLSISDGSASTLELGGNPEPLYLTL